MNPVPLPPKHPSVEVEVIGACLTVPTLVERVMMDVGLEPGDFSVPVFAKAWAALLHLHAQDGTATAATLEAELEGHVPTNTTAKTIVADALAAPWDVVAIVPNARLLKRAALQRTWADAAYKLLEAAGHNDEGLVAEAESILTSPTVSQDTMNADSVGMETLRFFRETGAVGIATGFPALDNNIGGGLRPGDSTALGAWTSMGKSALVDQILTHASRSGATCHAYVNEMSIVDRGIRCIARETNVPYGRLVTRDIDDEEHKAVVRAAGRIPFGITDCAQWSADRIGRHIRANKWDLCVLDLLHNMPYRDVAELDQIIATLGASARSAGSHLIIVCQFNEERAKNETLPQPVMRDLRGSGMIKNVCANVLLLHRAQTAEETLGERVIRTSDEAVILIDKARHGRRGTAVSVDFEADSMTFNARRGLTVAA